jgi:type IV pilus assembly protein PilO
MNPRVEKFLKLPAYQRGLVICVILLLVVGGFAYFLYLPKHEEYRQLLETGATLQAKLEQDRRIARDLPKFEAEYERMKQQLDEALTQLPNEKEIPTLLTNIASLAKDQGLDVLRFKPSGEVPKGFYAEVPVELKLSGSFHQIALFFQSVGELPRIVNMGNLIMGSAKTADGRTTLTVDCLATTFRFIENSPAKK